MPIFIAKDFEGSIENIVYAKNKELATVYWQGKDIFAHTVTSHTEEDLVDHITGVIPILDTRSVAVSRLNSKHTVRVIS